MVSTTQDLKSAQLGWAVRPESSPKREKLFTLAQRVALTKTSKNKKLEQLTAPVTKNRIPSTT
jgi:hypothetical protein